MGTRKILIGIVSLVLNLFVAVGFIRPVEGGLGVSVSPTTWTIGDVKSGQIKNAGTNYFTISNTGTQFEKITMKVSNSTPGGMKPGTAPGKDIFVLKYGNLSSTYTTLTTTETTLVPWIIDGDYYQFDLQFQSPADISSKNGGVNQTITVTVSAYADTPTPLENRTLPSRAPFYSSVICYIPQFTPEWGGTAGGFWCDKYESSQPNVSTAAGSRDTNPSLWPVAKNTDPGTVPTVSLANKPVWDHITLLQALKACRNRGSGFHLITAYEFAAVAQYAKQVYSRQIPGNNNYALTPADQDPDTSGTQYGIGDITMTGADAAENNRKDLTGSGPIVWSIDGGGLGPYDISGNVWEKCQGLFLQLTTGFAYIYDLSKTGNYGECTKVSGANAVILNTADDGTDLTSVGDNYWGTSGYYLYDSLSAFHQITAYTASTKTLSLGTTPAAGTYVYGIYKATTTNITSGMTTNNRILTIRNSDSDLKYYAIPATSDATGDSNYGTDGYSFDTGLTSATLRGGSWGGGTFNGGFLLNLVTSAGGEDMSFGIRACK